MERSDSRKMGPASLPLLCFQPINIHLMLLLWAFHLKSLVEGFSAFGGWFGFGFGFFRFGKKELKNSNCTLSKHRSKCNLALFFRLVIRNITDGEAI